MDLQGVMIVKDTLAVAFKWPLSAERSLAYVEDPEDLGWLGAEGCLGIACRPRSFAEALIREQASSVPVIRIGHPGDHEEVATAERLDVVDQWLTDEA
jgi:hypothetical protein